MVYTNYHTMDVYRYGVCSGWLSRLGQQVMSVAGESSVDPPKHQEQVSSVYFMAVVDSQFLIR